MTEDRGQRADDRGQMTEGGEKWEVGMRKGENKEGGKVERSGKSECGRGKIKKLGRWREVGSRNAEGGK